ncbi:class I SAM-dependent methyltransferase [Haliscomenobacter hydrossis]|uniref:Methyltransferase type 11 n=1 Tax=Haliscomenobacter hydrossis (strain ATCC 27775 / DSM 1100 / LMG 10767 / O) TaxID=760192 RepID=F4L7C1_HALH1|nr:class I SAM-dependent methyltransferase [Haliscomenobacter hydrossis]AEE53148.1 Methyltransferase type 11 [Haliscomenobacter hydrossis DSM 1100]
MKASIDNFSTSSAQYAQFRPDYPTELFEYLYSRVSNFDCAWDCGTGNGQVALTLAERFASVQATDLSANQIANATPHPRVHYGVCRAEASPFSAQQFDLITVAQALHWFDFAAFNQEVKRVAKPGALIAVWGYGLLTINAEIDLLVQQFYTGVIDQYWDAERHHIDEAYANIPFPFAAIEKRTFSIEKHWNLAQLCGYLGTWSSVKKYIQQHGEDPLAALYPQLQKQWPEDAVLSVRFPIFLQTGIV